MLRVKPAFQVDNENAPAVAGICARLDGLPLAIELAAARMRIFSPDTLLSRLDDRLALLTGGHRDLPDRQRTLRGAIDWSCQLLDEREKQAFACASVFAGGFTFESAEAVYLIVDPTADDVLDLLSALADKSLFRLECTKGEEPRLSMLESIREFARERLRTSDLFASVTEAHAHHFLSLAKQAEKQMIGPAQHACLHCMRNEHDNLREALWYFHEQGDIERKLDLAASIWHFWKIIGHYSEGRRWLSDAGDEKIEVSDPVRARALRAAGCLAQFQGDINASKQALERSRDLFEAMADGEGVAYASFHLGWAHHRGGDLRSAEECFTSGRMASQDLGDQYLRAQCDMGLGSIQRHTGQIREALQSFTSSLEVFAKLDLGERKAHALGNIGTVHYAEGDYPLAQECFARALEVQRELNDVNGQMLAYNNLGDVSYRVGNFTEACHCYSLLAQLAEDTGNEPLLSTAYAGLSEAYVGLGRPQEALDYARNSLELARKSGGDVQMGSSYRLLGEANLVCGNDREALEDFQRSVRQLRQIQEVEELARAHRGYKIALSHCGGASGEHAGENKIEGVTG